MPWTESLQQAGNALGNVLADVGTHSANAAIQANKQSAASQAAQGAFNQASADNANLINQGSMQGQWGFNSAMMQNANEYNTQAWQQAAEWNEAMWEKQAAFNAEQAQIQRDWSERMENTRYQRAISDMSKAGLNPILAVTGGGISTGAGSATAASVGGAQMSSASAQMASGGLLGANSASEGNYQGQMEFMGGMMGLLSATIAGISSAMQNAAPLGEFGEGLLESIGTMLQGETDTKKGNEKAKKWLDDKASLGDEKTSTGKAAAKFWGDALTKDRPSYQLAEWARKKFGW